MPAAIHGVNTALTSDSGCASEIDGREVMPRDRHVSPRGADSATSPRIIYCRGVGRICVISSSTGLEVASRKEEGRTSAIADSALVRSEPSYAPAPTAAVG